FIRSPPGLPAVLGLWQHVALTYDKTTGEAALYVNGNPVTQTNLGIFTPQTAADLNLGYQTVLLLPRFSDSGGAMDEVTLYARALGPSEIRSIMLARANGKCRVPPSIVAQPVSARVNGGQTVMLF